MFFRKEKVKNIISKKIMNEEEFMQALSECNEALMRFAL